ncbi:MULTISPECIES: nucleotidyltransferase [Enterobacteriaceae]|uniref:nucleotidyltransferase domain-containing protein n=1 Tax=Enterobacteriaceae TaxID=543 RepID=UPI001451C1D7|nr:MULTISPECIES: nucleotidyltransferase [Enterobacteriaceae]MCL6742282.1 nucleotidyltransferase [Kosakonia sp. R1.Fl]QJF18980.1 nucleotidyltransferase [Phytobacter diazotrophicus]
MSSSTARTALSRDEKLYVGGFLDCIVESLDLSATQYKNIKTAYEAVGTYLAEGDDEILAEAIIYSQGSVRLNTTVKPKGSDQYDVDLICYLPNASNATGWAKVLEAVRQRLSAHGIYSKMLTPLPRGFRIMYAGQYHLDITPGIDASYNPSEKNHPLWVPDSRLMSWKASNPAGYASWFDQLTEKKPIFRRLIVASFESRATADSVMPLPDHTKKKLLNRIVQLFKRHRDVWAEEQGKECVDLKPISAIITTLAAHAYNQICDEKRVYDTDFDVILDVLDLMPEYIKSSQGKLFVTNPMMAAENFAEKWNITEGSKGGKLRNNFLAWHTAVISDINEIANSYGEDQLLSNLSKSFGERPVQAIRQMLVNNVNNARNNNTLKIAPRTATLTMGAAASTAMSQQSIPSNTFYGGNAVSPTTVQKNTFFGD